MAATEYIGMKNLKTRKLYFQVYDEIKAYIAKNNLRPGDKLPTEKEMCELLGVSRNVLREAIKSLEITGVVSSTPGVGIVIQEFNTDYLFSSLAYGLAGDGEEVLSQFRQVRRVLEIGFLQEAFESITPKQVEQLRSYTHKMDEITKSKSKDFPLQFGQKFAEADAGFHKALFANVKIPILHSIIDAFWACDKHYQIRTSKKHLEMTVDKHERILRAVENEDYGELERAMEYHYNTMYKPGADARKENREIEL